jgi:hypothetical protein
MSIIRPRNPNSRLPTLPAIPPPATKPGSVAPPRMVTVWIGDTAFRAVLV